MCTNVCIEIHGVSARLKEREKSVISIKRSGKGCIEIGSMDQEGKQEVSGESWRVGGDG